MKLSILVLNSNLIIFNSMNSSYNSLVNFIKHIIINNNLKFVFYPISIVLNYFNLADILLPDIYDCIY